MDNLVNICQTCLNRDRLLFPLSKLQDLIMEIGILELKSFYGYICWECHRIMGTFLRFKKQVNIAQTLLRTNEKNQDLKCLSRLSCITKYFYDSEYYHHTDPLTNTDRNMKTELEIVKEESQTDSLEDADNSDCDKKIDINNINVYVETVKHKRPKKIKHKKKKTFKRSQEDSCTDVSDKEEVNEKFSMVVYTEEEMLRHREEKRNQPNFKKIPFKCDMCVLGFTRKETFDVHMQKKHDENIGEHQCDVCQVRFTNEKSVQRHRKKHFVCYKCKYCKYETVELWSALNHGRVKHRGDTNDRIHCRQCDTVAKTPEDLAEHIRTQHLLFCNECGEKFKGKNTLRTHKIRIHAVKREFICDICTKTFMTKTRLESHMVGHNATIAKKLAYCTVCNVQYKNIYVYRNHLKNSANHSERAYPCPECDKKFASKVYWTKHYNFYHLQKSQFSCELCNKLFISDWRLKNHKQKHHGLFRTRDHSCNVCGKKFFTLSTLKGHQLTHSEQRSYMCEDCGDTFKQRPALYTHTRLVHKGVKRRK